MAVAKFGADVTGAYEAQNFVRPQEGIQDGSAETLLKTAASATQQGYQLTAAFKAKEFRGELDSAVNQEIGKQMLATQEAQPSDTEEFKSAIERAKQVYAQGGAGAKTRTSLLAEKLTREKAGANPLFAKVYRQVAQEVLGDYDATLQFMTAAEEAAARKAQSEAEGMKDLVSSVYRMHERAGGLVPFTKPPESMTSQELQEYIITAGKVAAARADEQRQREAMKDELSLRRTIASEQGAAAAVTSTNIALQEQTMARQETKHATSVQASFDSEFDSGFVREILNRVSNGELSTLSPEFRAQVQNRMASMRSRVNQQLNTAAYSTDKGRQVADGVRAHMESRFEELNKLVNGPFSELQTQADLLKYTQDSLGLEAIELAPEAALYARVAGPQAAAAVMFDVINGNSNIQQGAKTSLEGGLLRLLDSAKTKQDSKGDLARMPQEHSGILRKSAQDRLSSQNPRDQDLISNPTIWGTDFVAATDAIEVRGATLSGREIGDLLNGAMTNNFVQRYEAVKTEDPAQAMRIADRYHQTARYVAPAAIKTILQKASDNFGINPENGYFVTDLPDQRVKTLVNQINALVDGLVATREQDRTAPQDEVEARLYFIEEFFR